jgi:hypothetical protein
MMIRALQTAVCAVLLLPAPSVVVGAQKPIFESEAKTVTASIEAVDKASRVVTLETAAGTRIHVTAPPEMEGFTSLRVGDLVSARYFEAVVVHLVRPGSPAPSSEPAVRVTRKDRVPGSETLSERTVRATITAVGTDTPSLTLKAADGREQTMAVTDGAQLEALKVGDVLDVTFYESRLVSVERGKK